MAADLVHGGASLYPGDAIARQGIVVVTFNYRVGRLGFFAHSALAKEAPDDLCGNYGYMEQLAVLKRVQQNIAAFGGDPQNVTIAGESAGGGSVLVHLTSPLSRRAVSSGDPGVARHPVCSLRGGADAIARRCRVDCCRVRQGERHRRRRAVALEKLRACRRQRSSRASMPTSAPSSAARKSRVCRIASSTENSLSSLPKSHCAGRQAMVPVIVGANDADLAASSAETKDGLFAAFGPFAAKARSLYDPKDDRSLAAFVRTLFPIRLRRVRLLWRRHPFLGSSNKPRFCERAGAAIDRPCPTTSCR